MTTTAQLETPTGSTAAPAASQRTRNRGAVVLIVAALLVAAALGIFAAVTFATRSPDGAPAVTTSTSTNTAYDSVEVAHGSGDAVVSASGVRVHAPSQAYDFRSDVVHGTAGSLADAAGNPITP